MPKQCNQSHPKASDPKYVCNTVTGRWIKADGPTAKQLGLSKTLVAKPKLNPVAKPTPNVCPPDKILNPATGRCVSRTGAIGKKILASTDLRRFLSLTPRQQKDYTWAALEQNMSTSNSYFFAIKPENEKKIYKSVLSWTDAGYDVINIMVRENDHPIEALLNLETLLYAGFSIDQIIDHSLFLWPRDQVEKLVFRKSVILPAMLARHAAQGPTKSKPKPKPKVVKPGALPAIYKKNDYIKNKKRPAIRALHEKIMKQYGLDFYKDLPIGSGSFAFIYDIGNNKILRLETSSGSPNPAKMALRVDQYMIKHPSPGLFPQIHLSEIHFADRAGYYPGGWTMSTVMDKVDIDDWRNWNKYFSSPDQLITAIKSQTKRYLDYGLIHLDPSPNNVVLTKQGEILFLDNSDGCLSKQLKRCPFTPLGTPGYVASGWQNFGAVARKKDDRKVFEDMLDHLFGLSPKDILIDDKNDRNNAMVKNLIHGMGAIAYYAITGLNPWPAIDFSKVHPGLRSMLHPDYKQRTL